jgi:methyl-accepting chemotaxis protein
MKKGMKITTKIILMVLLPLIFISVSSIVMAGRNQEDTAYDLMEEKLQAIALDVDSTYQVYSDGDYSYEDGVLKKGDLVLSDNYDLIDRIKQESNVEVTLFWGTERAITTVTDSNGKRAVGTTIDADFAKEILAGTRECQFTKSIEIAGADYCGYYVPLTQNDGEIVGLIFTGRAKTDVVNDIRSSEMKMALGMLVILLVTAAVVTVLVRKIITALKHTTVRLDEVATGRLDIQIESDMMARGDEIGDMYHSIQSMVDSLKGILHNLMKNSHALENFSDEFESSFDTIVENITSVNGAIGEVANGAAAQANETMEANNEIVQMGNSIEGANSDIEMLNQNSIKMQKYSHSAEETLQELADISSQTSSSIEDVKQQTNLTNESAQAIQKATDMITSIASQTNMLSLNASIEAARAGENGRGFAVVADEIRNLSEQSRESAEQITSIVSELILNSNTSVETMNLVSEGVEEQNEKLENTKNMFISLNQEIESVSHGVEKIQQSMVELGRVKDTVLSNVEQLAAIAEENAASTEETSASMTELQNIVQRCQEQIQILVQISSDLNDHTQKFTL